MSPTGRRLSRRTLLALAPLGAAAVSGCVMIPTDGAVEQVEARPRAADPSVAVAADPPQPGASPLAIVTGFLQAMTYYQPDYAIAREYLASSVRAAWRPGTGVTVYADNYYPTPTGDSVTLQAPVVGRLGADGSYRPASDELSINFGLVRDDTEWRIGRPPEGLLVSRYDFAQFYNRYNLYFYEPGLTWLVPDPIFLPAGTETATALVTRLLQGPSDWLSSAVVSALPAQTRLNVSAPVDADGVVAVSFSEGVAGLSDEQRSQVAGQVIWTLRQVPGVTGVRFDLNGTHWSVPRDEVDGVVRVTAMRTVDPVPIQLSSALFGATADGLVRIEDDNQIAPVTGVWAAIGRSEGRIDSLAISPDGMSVAAVIDGALLAGALDEAPPRPVVTGERLLRPQFSRYGELWTVDARSDGGSVLWRVAEGRASPVDAPALRDGRVVAFRLAPDGVRMAVLLERDDRVRFGLALVNRTATRPVVEALRSTDLYLPQRGLISRLTDIGWRDATSLMVLGAAGGTAPVGPYTASQDGATAQAVGYPDQWNATALAVSPRDPAVLRAVLRGSSGRVWRYSEEFTWSPIAEDMSAVAFPG